MYFSNINHSLNVKAIKFIIKLDSLEVKRTAIYLVQSWWCISLQIQKFHNLFCYTKAQLLNVFIIILWLQHGKREKPLNNKTSFNCSLGSCISCITFFWNHVGINLVPIVQKRNKIELSTHMAWRPGSHNASVVIVNKSQKDVVFLVKKTFTKQIIIIF